MKTFIRQMLLLLVPALMAAGAAGAPAASAAETVYIPLGQAGEVLVVDAATATARTRFSDLPDTHGLAVTPDGRFLVAGSFAESKPEAAGLPPKPEGMAQDEHAAHHATPAPTATLPTQGTSYVSIVRADDGTIVRRIEVPGAVHHTAVSPDGRFAVATHPNGGGISVIDLATLELMATVMTGPLPNYAVVSPDGARVYVSNAGNGTVSEVDSARWFVRRNFLAGDSPEHLALSHDGHRLYVANVDAGTVSEISTATGEVGRRFEIGGTLHGLDLSENGQTLFISARARDRLVAINLHTVEVREAQLGPQPYHLTTVGAETLYVSSAAEPVVWVVDPGTLTVRSAIPIAGEGHQMAVTGR